MLDLRIETATNALKLLQRGWPTRAVSLVGDDLRFPLPRFGDHHIIVEFHDVEIAGLAEYVAPTAAQLAAVLEHTADLTSKDRLLIHCHAGKSRSPAMAMGVLINNGMTPQNAFDRVRRLRPALIPNRLMIQQIDEILRLEGKLVRIVSDHYARLPREASLPDRGGWNL